MKKSHGSDIPEQSLITDIKQNIHDIPLTALAFAKRLFGGKFPLWIVFWFVHSPIYLLIKALQLVSFTHIQYGKPDPAGVMVFWLLMLPTSIIIYNTADWQKQRDWDKQYNDALMHKFALILLALQWVSFLTAYL